MFPVHEIVWYRSRIKEYLGFFFLIIRVIINKSYTSYTSYCMEQLPVQFS